MNPRDPAKGQAMIETLIITVIITAFMFAAMQLCVTVIDDMTANEAAFASMRVVCVAPSRAVQERANEAANQLLGWNFFSGRNNFLPFTTEARVWNETINGHQEMRDHSGVQIRKFTTGVRYAVSVMFPSLFQPFHHFTFFSGGNPILERRARARMVRSPDETYYYRAYPGGRPFTREPDENQQ